MDTQKKNIFLTGAPSSGKTTVIRKIVRGLAHPARGFYFFRCITKIVLRNDVIIFENILSFMTTDPHSNFRDIEEDRRNKL